MHSETNIQKTLPVQSASQMFRTGPPPGNQLVSRKLLPEHLPLRHVHLYAFYNKVSMYACMYEVLSKVLEMHQEKNQTLKILIATVPFKAVPLGACTAIPTFLPRSEAVLEVLLCQRLQHLLRFGLDLLYGVKSSGIQLDFYLGVEEEVTGG